VRLASQPYGSSRKPYYEFAPAARPCTARFNRATVKFNQPFRQGQPDSQSAFGTILTSFHSREHREHPRKGIGVQPHTGVGDRNGYVRFIGDGR
jgi:hypothetical protein